MTRQDARDFLAIAQSLQFDQNATEFSVDDANRALDAVKNETAEGSAVIVC